MSNRDRRRSQEMSLSLIVIALLIMTLAAVFGAKWGPGVPENALPINEIDAPEFARVLGVDKEIAQRLTDYRTQQRGFADCDRMLEAPLFPKDQAGLLAAKLAQSGLDPRTATARKFASGLAISPAIARRVAEYRDSLLPPMETGLPEPARPVVRTDAVHPAGAHGAHEPAQTAPAPPLLRPDWLSRAPLLDTVTTRPLVKRFVIRTPAQVLRSFWIGTVALILAVFLMPPWLHKRGSGDPFLLPLALLLCGFGAALLFSIKDPFRDHASYINHFQGIGMGLFALVVVSRLSVEGRRRIKSYQYVWVLAAIALVSGLALFGSGPEGVKLSLFHFQPVEIIKLMLVFFAAGYLADRASLIADSSKRWTPPKFEAVKRADGRPTFSLDLPRIQDIGPLLTMYALTLALFFIVKDMGPGLLLFATFVSVLYLSTGRTGFILLGCLLVLVGGILGYLLHVGVFAVRVDMWLHPFANTHSNGMQLGQGYWGMATGGVEGSGLGLGMPGSVPRSGSDLAFVSWAEETGLIGAWLALTVYAVLVWRGFRIALSAGNEFDRALAFGLTSLFGLQTLLIVGGVTGLIPLTGISLPFLSYGNSALVADFIVIGLLRGISMRPAGKTLRADARPEIRRAVKRYASIYILLLLGLVGVGRLGWIQAVKANEIAAQPLSTPDADKVVRPHINPRLLALAHRIDRGSIYDRSGRVLATSRPDEIAKLIPDKQKAARMVASHARYYPYGPALAHLIGFLDAGVGGPSGFEKGYNADLRGYKQLTELLSDYRHKDWPWPWHQERKGRDLTLAIDANLQKQAQAALAQVCGTLKDKQTGKPKDRAAFVLMDPATGDVLAAATLPTFDPNTLTPELARKYVTGPDVPVERTFINRAVYGVYPPGSTLKVATAAAAFDNEKADLTFTANRVDPEIRWRVNGVSYVRRNTRDDKGDPAFGTLDMTHAFRVSSNIYFAEMAVAIGSPAFRETLSEKMGFRYVPTQSQFDADLPDIGYGQGRMLASPVEMARLAASVANRGTMMKARFATKVQVPGAKEPEQNLTPTTLNQAMREQTAASLRVLMRSVVTGGTARGVFDDLGIAVAGKTGTAQNEQNDREPHSWFIGFAPYSEDASGPAPKYAFACVVENGGYGKRVAAVVCRDMLKKLFGSGGHRGH